MTNPVRTKAGREAIALLILGLILYPVFVHLNLYESLQAFLDRFENWQADEIVMAVLTAGLMGFVYAWRRSSDLKKEIRCRDAAEQRANWAAFHDPLTQLPNRYFAEDRLKNSRSAGSSTKSVFAVDLDGFKKINDLLGHHGGDELLVTIAQRMRDQLPDDIVIRMGGDEFLILSAAEPGDAARVAAERIVSLISRPLIVGGIQVDVGASIGIANIENSVDFAEAVRSADVAMYEAKRRGRNGVCLFQPEMKRTLAARVAMEKALRRAIEEDRIELDYQPLVRLDNGVVHGFEALARWTDDQGISVPPSIFIGVAEEAGLITDLSSRLLWHACTAALEWPASLRLAFNISPSQLTDRRIGDRIVGILADVGFPPERLEIEITESAVVRDLPGAVKIIEELRRAGIRIVLDDFGTGFSSLSQLANMPFDKIKIDRGFTDSLVRDEKTLKVVKAIVGLGYGLGIPTTAEGIEEGYQLEQLKRLGCDYGQGYLFGRPMPATAIAGFLEATDPIANSNAPPLPLAAGIDGRA